MQMFYSAATGGFYAVEVHGDAIPEDALSISDELYAQLIGCDVVADPYGMPMLRPAEVPTLDQRAAVLLAGVDAHLNAAAKAKGYDSILSAALRAALPVSPFHAEGVAFGTWMDLVYAKCYEVMASVQAGQAAEPSLEQLVAMLPTLQLPE